MKYSCDLIRDLLPLYCDQVCSRDSAQAVEEHISACEECQNIYMGMRQSVSIDSAGYEEQQLSSMRKVKKRIKERNTVFATIGIIFGIILVIVVLRVLLIVGLFSLAVAEGEKDYITTTDIDDYGVFEGFNGYSGLDIFPRQLGSRAEVYQYSYYYADTLFDPTAQIYLECGYEEDDYTKEIERLKGIREEYKGRVQSIVYDTESFAYPAYVTVDADNHCYEYALLIGEGRIAYVFLQFIEEEDIVFPAEYLPKEYGQRDNGFSIYIFRFPNGDGYGVF